MKALHELKDRLCKELEQVSKKELSSGTLDIAHKITDTIKNIDKILMNEDDGYSHNGGWEARGSYDGGSSYARRRDSMGRYTRDGYSQYSRDGYSNGGSDMASKLEEMMRNARSESERQALERCMHEVKGL